MPLTVSSSNSTDTQLVSIGNVYNLCAISTNSAINPPSNATTTIGRDSDSQTTVTINLNDPTYASSTVFDYLDSSTDSYQWQFENNQVKDTNTPLGNLTYYVHYQCLANNNLDFTNPINIQSEAECNTDAGTCELKK